MTRGFFVAPNSFDISITEDGVAEKFGSASCKQSRIINLKKSYMETSFKKVDII
ncbi:MAG: hypothetical protein HGA37_07315 [Lentimicrobium sp.]|nr:hypothetical protein [Lentimicrobium sp.]